MDRKFLMLPLSIAWAVLEDCCFGGGNSLQDNFGQEDAMDVVETGNSLFELVSQIKGLLSDEQSYGSTVCDILRSVDKEFPFPNKKPMEGGLTLV